MTTINLTPSELSVPSISSACILVELSISAWTGRKLDKKQSTDVALRNHAASGMANVHKKLMGDCPKLLAVQKYAANARSAHYALAEPWSNSGLAVLPTSRLDTYNARLTMHQQEFKTLASDFLDDYSWQIAQAQLKLGDMFDPMDYPSTESLRNKFKFEINYMPMPEVGDFRVDVGNDAKELLTSHYKNFYESQVKSLMDGVWHKVYDALTKMSERLDYSDSSTKKIFRDTLVSNVQDVIDTLDAFNMTNDTQMSAMKARLQDAMIGVTPDALREDDYLRSETKRTVDDIIKSLPSLDM
jgi:hypothetical protein